MEFGISTASFYPQLTEVTLKELSRRGISCAEVFFNTLCEISPSYAQELRRIADGSGLKIVSVHPFTCAFDSFMLFTGYERRLKDALEWHKHYFEAMNILGSGIFVFHGDRMQGKLPDEEYYRRFAMLRDIGKQFGVIVAQENVERCRSRSLPFLVRMAEYLGGDFAVVFDNKQAFRSGVGANEFIDALGDHIVHVHISDNGPAGDCLPIGKGTADLSSMLFRLRNKGYHGRVLVELYGEYLEDKEEVYESIKRLRTFHLE